MNYHMSIDYDEGDQASYRAVDVSISKLDGKGKWRNRKGARFETGDVVADWRAAVKWVAGRLDEDDDVVLQSSSCDHFTMDGDDYGWTADSTFIVPVAEARQAFLAAQG